MSSYCIYLDLDEYLGQWLIHRAGGDIPVELPKASIESKCLEIFLIKRPSHINPMAAPDGAVPIKIPSFRYKPAETYNYLPQKGVFALVKVLRDNFDYCLWRDIHHFGSCGKRQDQIIYAWMEANGIEPTEKNWNAIAKRYQRLRKAYAYKNRKKG